MRINRENYEEYLVDFAEGTLSDEMMQEVKSFLLLNSDIQDEFDMFTDALVETVDVDFKEKDILKKIPFEKTTASSDYFQRLCVAHIEGLNTVNDEQFLQDLVNNDPDKFSELQLFEKTKLLVEQFNYNEKLTLKHDNIIHNVSDANFEEYCIACMEGWLDQSGLVALNNFIAKNPAKKDILDTFYKTRLHPDLSIIYPDKRKIKRFNILSPTIKKYGSIISSAAAILVLGIMLFYTTTVDDTAQMASSAVNKNTPKETLNSNIETLPTVIKETVLTEKVLKDPFGLQKISAKPETEKEESNVERIALNKVEPIILNEIDCPPCKQIFENKSIVSKAKRFSKMLEQNTQLAQNTKLKERKKASNHLKSVAQNGLNNIEKITKNNLKIEKSKAGDKTRIAFNSKYFSFSTQVNRKQK